MNASTRSDYLKMANEIVQVILANLDRPLDFRDVADVVAMSPFHVHRVFSALAGESINEMHRRLRLERACYALKYSQEPVGEIALLAGYGSHESFVRGFKAVFSSTPSEARSDSRRDYHVRVSNGVHFFSGTRAVALKPAVVGDIQMEVNILENCESRRLAIVPHQGAYHLIGSAFEKLGGLASQNQLWGGSMIAIYYDSPELTAEPELRSAAGIEIMGDRPAPAGMDEVSLSGGRWACYRHVGPYSGLGDSWNKFSSWLVQNGYEFGMEPAYELYVNDCSRVAPHELLTDLYISVKP
ncbi:MAG: AraC family transcriptional regulator [Armatimonadota bacterium]